MDDIRVSQGDGTGVNCFDYTVIHIAAQVTPKEIAITRVLEKARDGARVLVRTPKNKPRRLDGGLSKGRPLFEKQVKPDLLSNVGSPCVCVVQKEPAGELLCNLAGAV